MQRHPISPKEMVASLWRNRELISALTKREVIGRYRGSVMGILWSLFNPVLMLAVYTFVFSVVFKARWVGGTDSRTEFALVLFAGLTVFGLFSETVNRAPTLVLGNVNYVKKVIFPLEILPVVALGSSIFHFLVSLFVWMVFCIVVLGIPPASALWLPVVLVPLILTSLGFSWFLASLGVYLRDVAQIVGVVTTVLMFLSPIFYPVAALPEEYRSWVHLSPVTFVVEQTRDVLIWGRHPDWLHWSQGLLASLGVIWVGFAWFQKTRKGFADVL